MNLLGKILTGLIVLSALFLTSCTEDDIPLEIEIDNATDVSKIVFDLPSATIFLDSLRTDNNPLATIGRYEDAELGKIAATSYNTLAYLQGNVVPDSARYDSAVLQLDIPNKWLAENPSGKVYFAILDEPIYDNVVYLSDKELDLRLEKFDSIDFSGLTEQDTILNIPLGRYGFRLYQLVFDSLSLRTFEDRFALIPSDDMNSLINVNLASDSTKITLYSSSSNSDRYETIFTLNTRHFTNVNRDFSGTELAGITNLDTVRLSSNTDIVAPLFGLYTALDLTQLVDYITASEDALVNEAGINISLAGNESIAHPGVQFYFYKNQYGISGEGLVGQFEDWVRTAILENEAYFPPNVENRTAKGILRETSYQTDVTIFVDIAINEFQNTGTILTDGVVVCPINFLETKKTVLDRSSNMEVFITSVQN